MSVAAFLSQHGLPTPLFEASVNEALGDRLRGGDADLGRRLWGSLANCVWCHSTGATAGYTFREAGGLIAGLIGSGSYMDWYMESPDGVIDQEVAALLAPFGWRGEARA